MYLEDMMIELNKEDKNDKQNSSEVMESIFEEINEDEMQMASLE